MLFQHIPHGIDQPTKNNDPKANWNDSWHEMFPDDTKSEKELWLQMPTEPFDQNNTTEKHTKTKESLSVPVNVSNNGLSQNNSFKANIKEIHLSLANKRVM